MFFITLARTPENEVRQRGSNVGDSGERPTETSINSSPTRMTPMRNTPTPATTKDSTPAPAPTTQSIVATALTTQSVVTPAPTTNSRVPPTPRVFYLFLLWRNLWGKCGKDMKFSSGVTKIDSLKLILNCQNKFMWKAKYSTWQNISKG